MIRHQAGNSKGNFNFNAYTYFGVSWAPHFHSNYELIYAFGGEIRLTVDGRSELMKQGDYALILPNQVHSIGGDASFCMWIAVFSEQFVPYFAERYKELEGTRSVFRPDVETDSFIKNKLILGETSVTMKSSCFCAACDAYEREVSSIPRKSSENELICRILEYVSKHYTEDITLSSVAREFGYEYHYLSRLLNKSYQVSFSALVNQHRVDNAARKLKDTDMSMTEIAISSGFSSIRNFNHAFKQIHGKTPREFRENK